MDLTRGNAQEIGSALDRAGVTWNYDDDGDVRVRFRSSQPPGTDAVFYEFDTAKANFSIRGRFLNARAVPDENGMTMWEVPLDSGHEPTAVAQKVVTVYLMPRPGSVSVQIHASIAPLDQPRPMHIKVIPGSQQVSRIERQFSGFVGTEGNTHFWMSSAVARTHVDEMQFRNMIQITSQVGLAMFDGPFTGWLYSTDV
ncbi:hypothetical protein [Marmoricola sp. URHB0036]|uniref:hypothetical protein n=1 Tax=Marmoricola sp. URHB0036 TaxID=1298863 RepID=UPI00048209B4|nr:hypothetical protein [Marmoricola sp. URHB0036]